MKNKIKKRSWNTLKKKNNNNTEITKNNEKRNIHTFLSNHSAICD